MQNPRYSLVFKIYTPRGGISIDPYYNYGCPETSMKRWQRGLF